MALRPNAGQRPRHSWGFQITQDDAPFGRTSLDEWLARRRDLYLTIHNTHNKQTSMIPARFEPTISEDDRSQTYALTSRPLGSAVPWIRTVNSHRYQWKEKFVQTLQCEKLQPQHKGHNIELLHVQRSCSERRKDHPQLMLKLYWWPQYVGGYSSFRFIIQSVA